MIPRAIIAEDEPVLRAGLKGLLATVWPELDIVAMAEDGLQATQLLERHSPDVLFLDIHMPGCSGLEVARAASNRCHVVFVTGYDQHAITAFEHGAVDYLMKPVTLRGCRPRAVVYGSAWQQGPPTSRCCWRNWRTRW